jgi:hemolysin activation/secretion protein
MCVASATFAWMSSAAAQSTSPVTVTPETLRPKSTDNGFRVDIPTFGGIAPPVGAEGLSVQLASATLEGGYSEVASESDAILARLRGQRVTLAQIYAAASEIEAAHARAGFVLARVAVPPQDLHDGGELRISLIDGFIEAIDVSALSPRVRDVVAARTAKLKGRHHLRLDQIEQPLLIANDVPGLTLRSTLMRGSEPGGTKLVLDGKHKLVSGSLGVDNQLDSSLQDWGVTAQVSINSAFGHGEQIYGFVASGYDVSKLFGDEMRERVLGAGAVIPVGDGRFTFNPEVTFSRTRPVPSPGAPPTFGKLRRLSLRAGYVLNKTRSQSLLLTGGIEQIEESNTIPLFSVIFSRDRYMAARLGLNYDHILPDGSSYGFGAQFSQGLGNLGAITVDDAVKSGVGFSRQGAKLGFTKLTAQARGDWSVGANLDFRLAARGQTSFGNPVFRAEQFSMEGTDGVSAYVGGVTAVDQGLVARAEIGGNLMLGKAYDDGAVSPYLFVAGGSGSIQQPTVLEPAHLKAASFGIGARTRLPKWRLSIGLEYAHGVSDLAAIDKTDRVNVSVTVRF